MRLTATGSLAWHQKRKAYVRAGVYHLLIPDKASRLAVRAPIGLVNLDDKAGSRRYYACYIIGACRAPAVYYSGCFALTAEHCVFKRPQNRFPARPIP